MDEYRADEPRKLAAGLPPVMFLGDHFGYPSGVAHGVTTYFLNVLPAIKAAGVDMTACFLREPHPAAAALTHAGIDPVFLSASALNPLVVRPVASLAKSRGCRIIHAGGIKATLVARIVSRMIGAKAVIHVHDLTYPSAGISGLHRIFAARSDVGLCVSKAVQEVVVKGYHVHPQQLRIAYNGIRLERIQNVTSDAAQATRANLHLGQPSRLIAMVGRMHAVKGHRGMIEMMTQITASCPDAVLLLIGDGPERADFEALTKRLGLQRQVRFLGHREDIPQLLAAVDMVVMPSLSEGMGLAAVEALAAGKPIVAYAVGGLPEVISDNHDGKLVAAGDQRAFEREVIALLNDAGRRDLYGKQGVQSANRFSIDRHIDVLLDCYREMAAGK
jgi:glycosyltransferase involved in cell wall biosynthesis